MKQIVEIQYLRAFAVLLVVLTHTHHADVRFFDTPLLGDFAYAGFAGVDIFFVISGFIIHHIYGRKDRLGPRFFLHRANRIYPLYWVFTGLAIAGYVVMGDALTRDQGALNLVESLTLMPANQPPILVVGWTLTHELYFYLVYGLAFLLPRQMRPWAALAWAVATLAYNAFAYELRWAWPQLIFSPFNLQFLAGVLIAHYLPRVEAQRWPALILFIAGSALALVWAGLNGAEWVADRRVRVAVYLPVAVGAVAAALAWRAHLPEIFAKIGDWSYSIYLGHILAIGVIARLMAPRLDGMPLASVALYIVCFAASIILGWVSYRFVETPMLNFGRGLIDRFVPAKR